MRWGLLLLLFIVGCTSSNITPSEDPKRDYLYIDNIRMIESNQSNETIIRVEETQEAPEPTPPPIIDLSYHPGDLVTEENKEGYCAYLEEIGRTDVICN